MSLANPRRKIVICDDDPLVRPMLCEYFLTNGFDVTEALNGADCLRKIAGIENEYCAMLIDVIMPELDGIEVTKEIRKRSISTPIILMSGYCDIVSVEQALSIGASHFFKKPYSVVTIAKEVAKLCSSFGINAENAKACEPSLTSWIF